MRAGHDPPALFLCYVSHCLGYETRQTQSTGVREQRRVWMAGSPLSDNSKEASPGECKYGDRENERRKMFSGSGRAAARRHGGDY